MFGNSSLEVHCKKKRTSSVSEDKKSIVETSRWPRHAARHTAPLEASVNATSCCVSAIRPLGIATTGPGMIVASFTFVHLETTRC